MQTHEWEALLDGTTPGPWEVAGCHTTWARTGPDSLFPEFSRRLTVTLTTLAEGTNLAATKDARLAAHAPAAVAEVVRLRQALEGRLRVWEKVADRLSAQGDNGAELMRLVLDQINHILEGDNNA